ncbi:LacI family DNA-binding transcriptional regulator [Microbacterium sp. NPDC096154]|uniref:LacI family DNA-binding transcriptional regulator n=1 Tax=Microbacterium sp. NPDC096154 TaxID=3155549 RepID=UPI0033170ED8
MLDVARAAGVSHQTVSRYYKFRGGLKPATIEAIETAVRELNYRPNLAARSMRTQRTGRIAVITSIPAFNPAPMLGGASAVANEFGYAMEVHLLPGDSGERADRLQELVDAGQFEGILLLAPVPASRLRRAQKSLPVVSTSDFDEQMHVTGELTDAAPIDAFMSRLVELGFRRFLHVAGSPEFTSARARETRFLAAVERLGVESLGVVGRQWTGEAGRDAILALPDASPPFAVIAANDLVAVGAMRGAYDRGWSVPGDVSITGWDNADVGEFLTPSLTTVERDFEALGRRSMRRLVAELRGDPFAPDTEPLHRIVWRESVGPASAR